MGQRNSFSKAPTPVEKAVYEILENRSAIYSEIEKALLRGSLVVARVERGGTLGTSGRVRILQKNGSQVSWDFGRGFVRSCFQKSRILTTVSAMRIFDRECGLNIIGFEEISGCGKTKVFRAK